MKHIKTIILILGFAGILSAQVEIDTLKTTVEVQGNTIRIGLQIQIRSVSPPDTTKPEEPEKPPEYAGTVTLRLERKGGDVVWLNLTNLSDRILTAVVLKNLFFDYVRCDDFRNRVSPALGYTGDGRITADSVSVEFIDPVERGNSLGIGIVFTGGILDEFDVVLQFGNDRVPINIGMLKEAEVDIPASNEPAEPGKIGIRIRWDQGREPDLAGYIVKYGMAKGSVVGSRNIDNPDTTFYDMDIFTGLTYWFCLQAFDRSGNVSGESEWVSFRG